MTLEIYTNGQRFETSFKDSEAVKIKARIKNALDKKEQLELTLDKRTVILNPGAVQNMVTVWS